MHFTGIDIRAPFEDFNTIVAVVRVLSTRVRNIYPNHKGSLECRIRTLYFVDTLGPLGGVHPLKPQA